MPGKVHHYKYTGYTLTHLPQNMHLIWETSTALYYVSVDANTEFWKYTIATGTDAKLHDRTQKTVMGWHDRTNSKIWLVDCDNGPSDGFDVWYLDTSDDSENDIASSAGQDAGTVEVYDIFMIGANVYVINDEERATVEWTVCWDVDTDPFVEKDKF